MEESKIDYHQLARKYFEGSIAPSEEEILFQFVNASPGNEDSFRKWEMEWTLSAKLMPEVSREWSRLQNRIRIRQSMGEMFRSKRIRLRRVVAAAAISGLLVLGGAYGIYLHQGKDTAHNLFALETDYGEKSKLTLADGTVVWLNAGSTLRYSGDFNTRNREVLLTGEAYFEVSKQPDGAPFTVKMDRYSILVKGTKFNVSSYPEDRVDKTTLLEGSIDILYKGRHIPVEPGEMLSLDKRHGVFTKQQVQPSQYKSWTEGRVEYDKITLAELAVRLSRKYDVRIHLDDSLEKEASFHVSLRNEETIGDIFKALSEILPIRYERIGRDVYVRKQ